MARRPRWTRALEASRAEARLAVDLYNRGASERSVEAFVMHLNTAWLFAFQAVFTRDGIDFRRRVTGTRRLLRDEGGAVKLWSLRECVARALPENDPVRANIEFFRLLRNHVAHSHEAMTTFAPSVGGKAQAAIVNYEEYVTRQFGEAYSLGDDLRLPLFLSSLTPSAAASIATSRRGISKPIRDFVRGYDGDLPADISVSSQYDFRVYLTAQSGAKSEADAVVTFVRADEAEPELLDAMGVIQVWVRTKQIPTRNLGGHLPSDVCRLVTEQTGQRFTMSQHTEAWKRHGVRPARSAPDQSLTKPQYCIWDSAFRQHLYSDAWVKKLVAEVEDASDDS